LLFGAIGAAPPDKDGCGRQSAGERHRDDEVYEKRSVCM